MASHSHSSKNQQRYVNDMGQGFGRFVDEVMRGRSNKVILNGSVGMASLDIGVPSHIQGWRELEPARMLTNNADLSGALDFNTHPLWDMSLDNLTIAGFPVADTVKQLFPETFAIPNPKIDEMHRFSESAAAGSRFGGASAQSAPVNDAPDIADTIPYASEHMTPFYDENIATSIGLPDLPYGGLAHFAHMGMAIYDTGRTFQDLWNEPALKHSVFKIMTHPEMSETLLHRGVMLTVMGMLHPLGGVIAIGMGYLCAHLVHTAFKFLDDHKDAVREVMQLPVLRTIYNATGIKEWAEAREELEKELQGLDPLEEQIQFKQLPPAKLVNASTLQFEGVTNEAPLLQVVTK